MSNTVNKLFHANDTTTAAWVLTLNKMLDDFKRRPDVISGEIFRMGKNLPHGWYEAISTCGYCVKVSDVFITEVLKKKNFYPNAKLLSVTIDENKFGRCGDGSHNAWHTCIDLLNGYCLDLTIAQFGSQYNNRFLWRKVDWLNEFQAIWDDHDVYEGLTYDEMKELNSWKYRYDYTNCPKTK